MSSPQITRMLGFLESVPAAVLPFVALVAGLLAIVLSLLRCGSGSGFGWLAAFISSFEGARVEDDADDGQQADPEQDHRDDQRQRKRILTLSMDERDVLHLPARAAQTEHERDVIADPDGQHP